MFDLRVGDYVLSFDRGSKALVYSEVILFLDRNPADRRKFLRIATRTGKTLVLTPSHLVLRLTDELNTEEVFAADLRQGDHLMVREYPTVFVRDSVASVQALWVDHGGVFAPLTRTGTLVVDDVLVSCYALFGSQAVAHLAFAPFRLYFNMKESFQRVWTVLTTPSCAWAASRALGVPPVGLHPYARLLYALADYFVPEGAFFRSTRDTLS